MNLNIRRKKRMMNKSVTFDDIMLFVRRCIVDNKLYIAGRDTPWELAIRVCKSKEGPDYINMYMLKEGNKTDNILHVDTDKGSFSIENLTNKEMSLFNVLVEDVKEQERYNAINKFNSFFDEELPPSSIDDLQDEEDE